VHLKFDRVSARGTANEYGISDEVTGECVGIVSIERTSRLGRGRYPTRTIRLFDSKCIGSFNTHVECVAFVKGVEAMLNYILEAKDVKGVKSLLSHMLEVKGCETPAEPAA
jgi:hypothetical protein